MPDRCTALWRKFKRSCRSVPPHVFGVPKWSPAPSAGKRRVIVVHNSGVNSLDSSNFAEAELIPGHQTPWQTRDGRFVMKRKEQSKPPTVELKAFQVEDRRRMHEPSESRRGPGCRLSLSIRHLVRGGGDAE